MTQENPSPASNSMTPEIAAVGTAWQSLSRYFAKTAQVPASPAALTDKYGDFDDADAVAHFVASCNDANACGTALGDAARLRAQLAADPGLLQQPQPPDFIYGETVWAMLRVSQVAGAFHTTLQSLPTLLAAGNGSATQRADNLKQVLVGSDSLLPQLVALKADALQFDQRIKPIQQRLQSANEAINQTTMLNLANQRIGALESAQAERAKSLAQAKQEADSAWIGKEDKRKRYETLLAAYQRSELDHTRKRQFVADVDNIFAAGTAAVQALATIANQFDKLGKVAADARALLMNVCTSASVEQLSDYPWVSQALATPDYVAGWSSLRDQTERFVQTALL